MFAAALGYAVTRLSGLWLLPEHGTFPLGVFLAGLVVTAASNIYARSANRPGDRSEEHTSELQSLMRISYAVFCLKKKILKHRGYLTIPKLTLMILLKMRIVMFSDAAI